MRLLPAIIMLFCIELINAQDTIPDIILKGHQYTVYCTDISKDNQYLVSGGWDNSVKLWDYKNAKEIQSFDYHKDMIRCLKFSNDNTMIASASRDKTIKINKFLTGDIITIENNYSPNIDEYYRDTYFNAISFSPDNEQLIFTLAGRNEIFFWDIKTNSLTNKIKGHEDGMKGLELSNTGKYIASIGRDYTMMIRDLVSMEETSSFRGHAGSVGALCFSKDDRYLVSGGGGNVSYRKPKEFYNLMLWDVVSGKLISILSGHVDVVMDIKFTPDGRYVASVSEDNSVRIWDVKTAQQIWKYESDCYFLSCAISPDGKYLAASSRDETIKIWDLNRILN